MRYAILLILALTTPAAAESYYPYAVSPGPAPTPKPFRDRGYFGGGAGLTVDHFFNAYVDIEGALRIGQLPLWLRGDAGFGKSADVEGGGDYKRLRAGLETRSCSDARSVFCLYLGLDAGVQTQEWSKQDEMTEHHRGLVYGTRFGLDAGGDHTRFRLGLELYNYQRNSDVDQLADHSQRGGGLTLAVIHRM